jgi:predicted nuclease of predicted toxin-antitoxin system
MERADDQRIWEYAVAQGFVIVSKDTDFYQRSILFGHPPKVIWLSVGNCPTATVKALLESAVAAMREFHDDAERSFLIVS